MTADAPKSLPATLASLGLILGGQKSGKSRVAETRAAAWLAKPGHAAMLLVTARAGDDEMRARIQRHQRDRAERPALEGLEVMEVPVNLPDVISRFSVPNGLIVVDCLTLWLTNLLMPIQGPGLDAAAWAAEEAALCEALHLARGPVLMVSNEIGLGLSPLSPEARAFVDALGSLHQRVAGLCDTVTLMVAGIEVPVKRGAPA